MAATPPQPLLQYKGSKRRHVKQIMEAVPPGTAEVVAPFIGGGAVELAMAHAGITVRACDLNENLVCWWGCILEDAAKVAALAEQYLGMTSRQWYWYRDHGIRRVEDRWERAALYYALHRMGWGGTGLAGGGYGDPGRMTMRSLAALARFECPNLIVERSHWERFVCGRPGALLFCDPPYFASERYGVAKRMNHSRLADVLEARQRYILTYPDNAWVRRRYKGCHFAPLRHAKYRLRQSKSYELLITSPDLPQSRLVPLS